MSLEKAIVIEEDCIEARSSRSICKFAAPQSYLFLMAGKRSLYQEVSEKIP
jgi:hypothetical protein